MSVPWRAERVIKDGVLAMRRVFLSGFRKGSKMLFDKEQGERNSMFYAWLDEMLCPLFVPGGREIGGSRSSSWARVRSVHLLVHPYCEVCGTLENREVHHILPFHLYPQYELVPSNLFTLCRIHHFGVGHDPDGPGDLDPGWAVFNPAVREDSAALRAFLYEA